MLEAVVRPTYTVLVAVHCSTASVVLSNTSEPQTCGLERTKDRRENRKRTRNTGPRPCRAGMNLLLPQADAKRRRTGSERQGGVCWPTKPSPRLGG